MTDPNTWVIDVDARNFEKDVLERSLTVPVLVDFWAPWCGPCKELGPRLEKRAREGRGRFLLAKVNLDENPELAQAFRVQAVPAVLALVGGRLADGFQGALPEAELDAFLDRIAPAGPSAEDLVTARARQLASEGNLDEAISELRYHLRQEPDDDAVRLVLVDLLVDAGRVPEAKKVFEKLDVATRGGPEGRALEARFAFAAGAQDLEELRAAAEASPDDVEARVALGKGLVAAKRYEEGLAELLEAVRLDPSGEGRKAKAAMLEVFEVLGLEDPVANDYRFKLSMEILV